MNGALLRAALLLTAYSVLPLAAAGQSWVAGTFPRSEASDVPATAQIKVAFSRDLDPHTADTGHIRILGEFRGAYPITGFSYDSTSHTLEILTGKTFLPGEAVTITALHGLRDQNGDTMPSSYTWRFHSAARGGTGTFGPPVVSAPTPLRSTQAPNNIVAADFDGDGKLDVAMTITDPPGVIVLHNNGNGAFTAWPLLPTRLPVSWLAPGFITASDFDCNGAVDLAVVMGGDGTDGPYGSPSIHLLWNDGTGHFTFSPAGISFGVAMGALSVADINTDGYPDLLLPTDNGSTVKTLINDHQGSFLIGSTIYLPGIVWIGGGTTSVTSGDLNLDGQMDLVINSGYDSTLFVFTNFGDAGFPPEGRIRLMTPRVCNATAAADFDANGTADFAAIAYPDLPPANLALSVFLSDGSGAYARTTYGGANIGGTNLVPADFNGDGLQDLLAWNRDWSTPLAIYLNRGGGDFSGPARTDTIPGLSRYSGALAGDFDGDGALDLFTWPDNSAGTSYAASVLPNRRLGPMLSFFPDSLLFARQAAGSMVTREIVFRNIGLDHPLRLHAASSRPAFFAVSPESLFIAPADSALFHVTFAPQTLQDYAESLLVSSNDPAYARVVIPLLGRGVVRAATGPVPRCPPDGALKLPIPTAFCWDSLPDIDAYRLRIYVSPDDIDGIVDTIVVGHTSCTVRTLPYTATLYWVVAAINAAGKGPYSPRRLFTTFSPGPFSLAATLAGSNAIRLTWRKVMDPDLAGYVVYSDTGAAMARIDSTTAETTLVIRHLPAGRGYFFRVTGHDSAYRETDFSPLAHCSIQLFAASGSAFAVGGLSAPAWADADHDGDLDLLSTGTWPGSLHETRIYRNDAGTFVKVWSVPHAPVSGEATWTDMNGDGLPDVLHGNYADTAGYFADIFLGDSAGAMTFTKTGPRLPGDSPSAIDADNDGDPDILPGLPPAIYRNDGQQKNGPWLFTAVDRQATFDLGAKCQADFDGDGRMDFVSVGRTGIHLFHNVGGGDFADLFAEPSPASAGKTIWADFDGDGDQDFCLLDVASLATLRVFRNLAAEGTPGTFTAYRVHLPGLTTVTDGGVCVGDYDNDGRPDALCWGHCNGVPFSFVFHNEGVSDDGKVGFAQAKADAPVPVGGNAAWADLDGDGRLDLTVTGWGTASNIYRNNIEGRPPLPRAPTGLRATVMGDTVWLEWKLPAGDTVKGKTFNIFVQKRDGRLVFSPLSDMRTGRRLFPGPGNASGSLRWLVLPPGPGTYRWSVQSVDPAYRGSPFAPPDSFTITTAAAPEPARLPGSLALYQNYPNPFNSTTSISYDLPQPATITIRVYNMLGQEVTTLVDGQLQPAGRYTLRLDASYLSSGAYFYRLTALERDPGRSGARNNEGKPSILTKSFILLR